MYQQQRVYRVLFELAVPNGSPGPSWERCCPPRIQHGGHVSGCPRTRPGCLFYVVMGQSGPPLVSTAVRPQTLVTRGFLALRPIPPENPLPSQLSYCKTTLLASRLALPRVLIATQLAHTQLAEGHPLRRGGRRIETSTLLPPVERRHDPAMESPLP